MTFSSIPTRILTFLFGAKLNYESCMAKLKPTQNGAD